jgi:hypothetical protein
MTRLKSAYFELNIANRQAYISKYVVKLGTRPRYTVLRTITGKFNKNLKNPNFRIVTIQLYNKGFFNKTNFNVTLQQGLCLSTYLAKILSIGYLEELHASDGVLIIQSFARYSELAASGSLPINSSI